MALAMFFGAAIGFERELADKPAGMRTHMLVAGAAALLVSLGSTMVGLFGRELAGGMIRTDPIRVFEAVIVGVSFIGAGTIIRRGGERAVEGLTTAASMLFTAGVGIAVGVSHYVVAIGAMLLALITLRGIRALEGWLNHKAKRKEHP
jgi:putative Mg2+ transporter-C (MgtC) family protein